ncbi:MAG: TIGR01212 family radical SAM protein, partial [Clostridia bacterium]|nr:TIGR01212 family radical SAM protein [Clostridia bacterium]
ITDQLKKAKELVSKKYKGDKFIAYFGSFTNTYADVSYLEKIFSEAINDPQVVVLSIATRPDCLDTDVIKLIEKLNKIKPVWIELGLQTSKPETVEYIRRGYDNKIYIDAVDKLKRVGVHVITHIILGLPYETKEDMLSTVEFAINTGTNGIKLQLLHVLENTDLYDDFVAGKFKVLDREEYIDLVVSCLKIIPKDIVIHRLTGDGPKRILVAPKWSADKKTVLNALNKAIKLANL